MIAQRLRTARPSATKAVTARAAELKALGRAIITLSQGEPDFDTPSSVADAAVAAIRAGRTRYTPVAGVAELRAAICETLERDLGLRFTPDQVTVGCGAKQVIFNALLATLDPGDEAIVPAPCWVSYPEMVALAGGRPVVVECAPEQGFKLSPERLEAAITPETKWLILNSPNNPTGAVYTAAELEALASVLRRFPKVWALCDDIYEKLVYPPAAFHTLAQVAPDLADRILLVNGVSKADAMTGWRVGYCAGPLELIRAMNLVQGQTSSHTSSVSQYAAIEALRGGRGHAAAFRAAFQRRRDLVLNEFRTIPGLLAQVPDGAFYMFVDCRALLAGSAHLVTDVDLCAHLLDSAGVALVPGSSFMAPGYFRMSFASSDEVLSSACARLREASHALNPVAA